MHWWNCHRLGESYIMVVTFIGLEATGALMQKLNKIRSISLAVCASVALASSAPAFAQHFGGGHFGGYRGGYGGYGGWRGGYGWGGGVLGAGGWGFGGLG